MRQDCFKLPYLFLAGVRCLSCRRGMRIYGPACEIGLD